MIKQTIVAFSLLPLLSQASGSGGQQPRPPVKAETESQQKKNLSVASTLVDATIEANCLKQHDNNLTSFIANKKECSAALNSLKDDLSEDPRLNEEVLKIEAFMRRFSLL